MNDRTLIAVIFLPLSVAVAAGQSGASSVFEGGGGVSVASEDSVAQDLFPHHAGDLWHWWHSGAGHITTVLTRDSLSPTSSHFLFYDNGAEPLYEIDSARQVFEYPMHSRTLKYKLDADSGTVWFQPSEAMWAWVARVETAYVFSRRTLVKVFRYGPGYPDSAHQNQSLEEYHLASGFGLIYWKGEPAYIEQLWGCVINGDTLGTITSIQLSGSRSPASVILMQNYPNPFNSTTTIEFELAEASEALLRVYAVHGQELATFFLGKLTGGKHRTQWKANALPSGIYLCRLQAGGRSRTIKMVLTK